MRTFAPGVIGLVVAGGFVVGEHLFRATLVLTPGFFAHHAEWQTVQGLETNEIEIDVLKFLLPVDVRLTVDVERHEIADERGQTENADQRADVQTQLNDIETTGLAAH